MTVIIENGQPVPQDARGSATALGNFDGVHRGHGFLLKSLRQRCPNNPLSVVTFEPHPRQFFFPEAENFRLTNADDRNVFLADLGVDYIFQLKFDEAFSSQTAKTFVHHILNETLSVHHIACGEGFAFGKGRSGDTDYLISESRLLNIDVSIIPPLQDDRGIISSSRIRHLLRDGHPKKAAELLGRVWSVHNVVLHGDQRGRTIGFPTANLSLVNLVEPMYGVYAVRVALPNGNIHTGVANLGCRPTLGGKEDCRLEVYLFDFNQDLYGQEITVWLHHFIRREKRFDGLDALQAQIKKDVLDAQIFFDNLN